MATTDLIATGLSQIDNWVKVGSLNPVDTINSDDGGTSYYTVEDWYDPSTLLFAYQDLPGDAVVINSLVQYATLGRSASGGASEYDWVHKYGVNYYYVPTSGKPAFPPPWTPQNSGSVPFGGGGGWTPEKVNTALFGLRYYYAALHDGIHYHETYHMVRVDYVPSGMFVIIHVLPFLGILSSSFEKIMRNLMPRVRYTHEELERIRQDIRNSQRAYAFPVQGLNAIWRIL